MRVAFAVALALSVSAVPVAAPQPDPPLPAEWPVDGPVVRPFIPPDSPYGPGHRGVDIAAAPGAVVRAALGGVVAFAGQVGGAGWVSVAHPGGLVTSYGRLDPLLVTPGQSVEAGVPLGMLAAAHLDFGARVDGSYIDPLSLLARRRSVRLVPHDPPPR